MSEIHAVRIKVSILQKTVGHLGAEDVYIDFISD